MIHVEDERVVPAFYFALRDTLVVSNLEYATRIAYGPKRWRVVTLGGGLIETSGVMSGGGKSVFRGKMGQKVQTKTTDQNTITIEELETMKEHAEETQKKLICLQKEQNQLSIEVVQSEKKSTQVKFEIKKLEQELRILIDSFPTLEENVNRQREKAANAKSDQVKVLQLETLINEYTIAVKKSSTAVNDVQQKIDIVNAQINEVQKKNINEFKDKIKTIDEQIEKLRTNTNMIVVDLSSTERKDKTSLNSIENMTTEIKNCEEKITTCNLDRTENEKKIKVIQDELEKLKTDISVLEDSCKKIKTDIENLSKTEHDGKLKRQELEESLENIQTQIAECKQKIPHWNKQIASIKLHPIPNQEVEILKKFDESELDSYSLQDIQYQLTGLEEKVQKKPNLSVIGEFMKKRDVYLQRVKVLEDITAKRNETRQAYEDVRKMRFAEFMQGYSIINRKLKEMYQMITLGGDAELELVDSMDPFNEGIVFSVRPPKKSWKQISNLSGGEKTLSSLALVFALHYYKPSPLYVMDEIDAALDFKNVSIVANYIKERTKNAQFIIISLRSNMFELSDHLIGICKFDDCTKSTTIENK